MKATLRWPSATPAFLASGVAVARDSLWPEQRPSLRLHKTSYLDGLRGLASLIVVICHYTEDNHDYFMPSFGMNSTSSSFIQLPFLRLVYSGRPMVHVFFIVSGFVLSYKPLKAIQAGDLERCHAILASSAFRRPIRLFGPCIVSTFFILMLSYIGLLYKPLPSLFLQLEDWWLALFRNITWPWSWDFDMRPTYDIHLWTIPVEFVHSMFLFMVIMVLAPLRRTVRVTALGLIMFYCLCCGRWAAFEFLGGCLIADTTLRRQETQEKINPGKLEDEEAAGKGNPGSDPTNNPAVLKLVGNGALVLLWCFIAGWPNFNGERTPGIRIFHKLTPVSFMNMDVDDRSPQKFWFGFSALGLVWAITQLDALQRLLESRPCQYLGRISYALYLVHGPILNLVQSFIVGRVGIAAIGTRGEEGFKAAVAGAGIKALIGTGSSIQQLIVWVLGAVIIGPFILCAAELFCKFVDLPIMAAARRFEDWCLEK